MITTTVTTNANLRGLLRTARRTSRMSQKDAAMKAGVSTAWWKRVESAYETVVSTDRLASMLEAVGVMPEHLDDIGEPELAEIVMSRQSFRDISVSSRVTLEEYLMSAPASEELRQELVSYVRARQELRPRHTEPFADQFNPDGDGTNEQRAKRP